MFGKRRGSQMACLSIGCIGVKIDAKPGVYGVDAYDERHLSGDGGGNSGGGVRRRATAI